MDTRALLTLFLIVIAAVVVFMLVGYYNRNKARLESERFTTQESSSKTRSAPAPATASTASPASLDDVDEDDSGERQFGATSSGDNVGKDLLNSGAEGGLAPANFGGSAKAAHTGSMDAVMPTESFTTEQMRPVDFASASAGGPSPSTVKDFYPGDSMRVEDLLPKDAANSKWAQANPSGQGDVKDANLLNAGFHIGINTIGQTRNGNVGLRSEPPNPRVNVGIWNQSTKEPDLMRRPLELGSA